MNLILYRILAICRELLDQTGCTDLEVGARRAFLRTLLHVEVQ